MAGEGGRGLCEGAEGLGEGTVVGESAAVSPHFRGIRGSLSPCLSTGLGDIGRGGFIQVRIRRRRQDCRSIEPVRLSF